MNKYTLLNIKKNKKEKVKEDYVLPYLYNLTHTIPPLKKIKLNKFKQEISKINNVIPLYDVYSDGLYLIDQTELYDHVLNKNYRFPTIKFIKQITEKIKENKSIIKTLIYDNTEFNYRITLEETNKRYEFFIKFMNYFDNDILLNSYIKALYNTDELGKSITLCKKPSFNPIFNHIKPYYTQEEIIKIAIDMKLLKPYKEVSNDEIRELCSKIILNDINCDDLIAHYNYIIKNDMIGLIRSYTLQGFITYNEYLRLDTPYNEYINNEIDQLIKLILNAPKINKSYVLYRFIMNDNFIKDLKVGDIFIEKGFISTTRDVFNKLDIGNILFEIHVPKNYPFLCIETLSQFPQEQEIIFAPYTHLKLISVVKNDNFNDMYIKNKQYNLKYIFEIVDVEKIKNIKNIDDLKIDKKKDTQIIKKVDFLKIENGESYTIEEKIFKFLNSNINLFSQFYVDIGDKLFLLNCNIYDSTSVYKNLYAFTTTKGLSIYAIYDNQQLFNLEFNNNLLVVNYNIIYSSLKNLDIINSNDFLIFISSVAYYFNIPSIVLYGNNVSCDNANSKSNDINKVKMGGTYYLDVYNYIKYGIKKYNNIPEITPKFKYELFDVLTDVKIETFVMKYDRDNKYNELYQIYENLYKPFNEYKLFGRDFYLWLVENNCYYVEAFINSTYEITRLHFDNPFRYIFYYIDPFKYLTNNKIIK
jgi:hypothetical protein